MRKIMAKTKEEVKALVLSEVDYFSGHVNITCSHKGEDYQLKKKQPWENLKNL
ncbi:MAG: hypothetical protein RSA49_03555 [Anaerovoracaceae bacterium]